MAIRTDDPRDRGYAWIVLAVCTSMRILQSCGESSTGVILLWLSKQFQAPEETLATAASLLTGTTCLISFFMSFVVARYGCRVVVTIGGIFMAVGFVSSGLATNIYLFQFTSGFISAIGVSTLYIASNVGIQNYFKRKESLAQGIGLAGYSLGCFFWPPLVEFFLRYYGWTGTFIILASILLHTCVLGMMMRPINFTFLNVDRNGKFAEKDDKYTEVESGEKWSKEYQGEEWPTNMTNGDVTKHAINNSLEQSHSNGIVLISNEKKQELVPSSDSTHCIKEMVGDRSPPSIGDLSTNKQLLQVRQESVVDSRNSDEKAKTSKWSSVDFSLLKNTHIILFYCGVLLGGTEYSVCYLYLPTMGVNTGSTVQAAAFLVSIMSITNCLTRIILTPLGDLNKIRAHRQLGLVFISVASAILKFCSWFATSYVGIGAFAAFQGVILGLKVPLIFTVAADIAGPQNIAICTGMQGITYGVAILSASYLSGYLLRILGSIYYVFTVFAFFQIGAALFYLINYIWMRSKL